MIKIKKDTLKMGIKLFKDKSPQVIDDALALAGLTLLNWVIQGSPKESRQPPIDTGLLWGSGSVFVNSKLIGVSPAVNGQGTPNRDYTAMTGHTITIGFNTSYAAVMHEGRYNLGKISREQKNSGNKFLERHLIKDKELLMEQIAKYMKDKL
jgi:hypothetical protein